MQFELKELKRRQEAEEAERQRLQAEADERAAAEAAELSKKQAEQIARDAADAAGTPQREHETGNYIQLNYLFLYLNFLSNMILSVERKRTNQICSRRKIHK